MNLRFVCFGLLLAMAACTSGSNTCSPALCPEGCCDSAGICQNPSDQQCGNSGGSCVACGAGMSCQSGLCSASSGQGGGSGGGAGDTGGGNAPVGCVPACPSDQVCSNQKCTAVPAKCPCPVETYCDLSTNACKVGCTGDNQCSTGRICDDTQRECHDGCRTDDQCSAGDICQNLTCVPGCRSDAQCSSGKICTNLACVTGCRSDNQCNGAGQICQNLACTSGCRNDAACGSGRICDNVTCRAGCRNDSQCGSGGVCQPNTLTCKTGCDNDAQCPKEQLCNVTALACAPGCHQDTDCNSGRICTGGQCRDGCRQHTDCPIDNYCDNAADGGFTCKSGCGAPTTTTQGGLTDRCNPGEACVAQGYCQTEFDALCTHVCQRACYGWACTTSPTQPYTCFTQGSNYSSAQCRETCTADSNCGNGQVCNYFTTDSQAPDDGVVRLCSRKCTSNTDCSDTVDPDDYNNPPSTCAADGLCHESMGSYLCYHTNPSALIP